MKITISVKDFETAIVEQNGVKYSTSFYQKQSRFGNYAWSATNLQTGEGGGGFAYVALSQARNADDTLIRELATQILGYPPDSEPDLQRRFKEARDEIASIDRQMEALNQRRDYLETQARLLRAKLTA